MTNPLERGTAQPLPELGAGCIRHFAPQALTEAHGTSYPDARALWLALHPEQADSAAAALQAPPDE